MITSYNIQKIRELLHEGFLAQELRLFCRDFAEFQPLEAQLSEDIDQAELAHRIVEYAQAVSQLKTLLAWAQSRNSAQYEAYASYTLDETSSTKVEGQVRETIQS